MSKIILRPQLSSCRKTDDVYGIKQLSSGTYSCNQFVCKSVPYHFLHKRIFLIVTFMKICSENENE